MSQEVPQHVVDNPPSEARNVQARFYTGTPIRVVIDGVVYSPESNQQGGKLYLQEQDILAELAARVDESTWQLIFQLMEVKDNSALHEQEAIEARMLELLPNHEAAIRHAFWPEEYALPTEEYVRHRYCQLAKAPVQEVPTESGEEE